MRSGQILNALNAQSHKKHAKSRLDPITEQSMHDSQINQFRHIKLPEVLSDPPSYFTQILENQHQSSLLSSAYEDEIVKVRKQREKNVYLSVVESNSTFLSELVAVSSHKNASDHQAISDVLKKRSNNVLSDLEEGKVIINRDRIINTREQADMLNEMDRARLLKIKDGSIRSKLDLLNQRMQEMEKIEETSIKEDKMKQSQSIQELNKKIADNIDVANYSLNSQKTKIAHDYVKHMSEQRRELKKREKLRQQREKKIQIERAAELKEAQSMKDVTKRQQILKRIQEKKKQRELEDKQISEKQAKIQKFLAAYRKEMPIFKRKQKEYQDKFIKPEKVYREEKLKEIKEKKKSYSLNDITTHQKKYEEFRKKEEEKKSQEKEMYKQTLKITTKQHYKGSIHNIVEQVDRQAKQKNLINYRMGKHRKDRMQEYTKNVLEEKKPKIDENKRKQLLRSLEMEKMRKEKLVKKYRPIRNEEGLEIGVESFYEKIPEKNRYAEGNKFLEFSKMKRNKNIVSNSMEVEKPNESLHETSVKALKKSNVTKSNSDPSKQIWQIRSKQMQQLTNNISSQKQFEKAKVGFANLDQKAAKRQEVLKVGRMNLEEHLDQKNVLDQFYIQSIKNKMRLLDD